jgi:hypothetical protein
VRTFSRRTLLRMLRTGDVPSSSAHNCAGYAPEASRRLVRSTMRLTRSPFAPNGVARHHD